MSYLVDRWQKEGYAVETDPEVSRYAMLLSITSIIMLAAAPQLPEATRSLRASLADTVQSPTHNPGAAADEVLMLLGQFVGLLGVQAGVNQDTLAKSLEIQHRFIQNVNFTGGKPDGTLN